MRNSAISVQPLGDRALTLLWTGPVSTAALAAKARAVEELAFPWFQEAVPAYRTITIHLCYHTFSLKLAADELVRSLDSISDNQLPPPRQVELPVVYGGEQGPDLAESAKRSGITEQQFVQRHAEAAYEVAMIGFAPGFPYLNGLNNTLAQPRHSTPRMKVSAGAVGIAGNQTGVYPVASPGGWQIIGRTSKRLFRLEADDPFLLAPGDIVKFVPVEEFEELEELAEAPIVSQDIPTPEEAKRNQLIPALTVLKPGLLTTVQDLGRKGWQRFGVSVGGAMDEAAARTANLLVNNDEDAAVLELTLIGGSYLIEQDLLISLCGADLEATANGERLPMNRPVYLSQETTLSFGRAVSGCRAYLAISGGIDVPYLLGSRSADPRARMGGGFGRALKTGDWLGSLQSSEQADMLKAKLRKKMIDSHARWSSVSWCTMGWPEGAAYQATQTNLIESRVITLRVLLGAEWEEFSPDSRKRLFNEPYRIEASSDRMGLRLSGGAIIRDKHEELQSHGVVSGTIQVPPNGQPIILAAACQPTGGYPKIAHVISADLPLLAQAVPGDWLGFKLTDIGTAEQALREREKDLAILKAGMSMFARS
ncbi:5-oxoprolinase subunit PxpB [Cohnella silvisoli]|uniref:5-oxoprolinase subunit PxpB n=1 Tax=Cohnella silvisoli TaxID=2873699 RepID=A0ABV1KYL5_9BACL|nr:5-oxoprolinase subunit PxpB [Cohnella silvisoli]MCD9024177.1 5-oxoprolinase subunit PxpB [Cohnella silvisoli]